MRSWLMVLLTSSLIVTGSPSATWMQIVYSFSAPAMSWDFRGLLWIVARPRSYRESALRPFTITPSGGREKTMAGGANRTGTLPAANAGFSLISDSRLIQLYRSMLQFRLLVRCARGLGGALRASATRSVAAVAGACAELRSRDALDAPVLGPLHGFFTGEPLEQVMERVLAPSRLPLPSPLLAALARKPRSGAIVLAIASATPRAPQSALWSQAFASPGIRGLPIVFVRLHNDAAKRRAIRSPASIPSITVDIHDVVAVYRVAFEAIARARRGSGPTLIECAPYRPARSGSRSTSPADPIRAMETYLRGKRLFTPELRREIGDDLNRRLSAAISAVRAMQPAPGDPPSE